MFPAITEAFREYFGERKGPIQELGLKSVVSFNPENVEFYARNGYPRLYNLLGGGGPSWSGETVSVDSSLNHSVVWACVRIIAETTAGLPLGLLRSVGDSRLSASDLPAH